MKLKLEALKAKGEIAVNNAYRSRRFLTAWVYSSSRTNRESNCFGFAQVSLAGKHSSVHQWGVLKLCAGLQHSIPLASYQNTYLNAASGDTDIERGLSVFMGR
jgi:hypothetical protein